MADTRSDVGTGPFEPLPSATIHSEWAAPGAALAGARGDIVVIVDVQSFSTSISVAVERGATAFVRAIDEIMAMGGRDAAERELDAELLARERAATTARFSLSPATLLHAGPGDRIVFTSLNGARCVSAAEAAPLVLAAGFRNRRATADLIAATIAEEGVRCTIVPCGERWTSVSELNDGLRPSIEDWIGAGALASALREHGLDLSAEATLAAAAFEATTGAWPDLVRAAVSGRELLEQGFSDDVDLALQCDVSATAAAWTPDGSSRREFVARRPA